MKYWYVVETEDNTSCSIYAAPNQALLLWDKVIKLQFLKVQYVIGIKYKSIDFASRSLEELRDHMSTPKYKID